MKRTSVPEQAILFYTRKYIDKDAENNRLQVSRYTADISFHAKNQVYIAEFDSYSMHHERIENDMERDEAFQKAGYKVIRLRDNGL